MTARAVKNIDQISQFRKSEGIRRTKVTGSKASGSTYIDDSLLEGALGELPGPVHGLSVIVRSPAGAIDVNMLLVQAEGARLHRVSYLAVQHTHTWR